MRIRTVLPIVVLLLVIVCGVGYFLSPALTVVTDPVYAESSLAQVQDDLGRELLFKGIRVRIERWDRLPETRDQAISLLSRVKGRWVLFSPAVTNVVADYRIGKDELPPGIFIGMGRDTDLTSATLHAFRDDGYPRLQGDDVLFVYEGEKPEVANAYAHSQRLDEQTETYAKAKLEEWTKAGYRTIVACDLSGLPSFFMGKNGLRWIVPSLSSLSVPRECIEGLVVDDLAASLRDVLPSLRKLDAGSIPLPLIRKYVPGIRMRGGSLSSWLRDLQRMFL
jgi:hypothetical protein